MKTSFPLLVTAAALSVASVSYALDWPSDMAEQIAALKSASIPAGNNAAAGATDSFQTFAIDEEVSEGVNFSTMPGATVILMR
jgi:hypothetical protein